MTKKIQEKLTRASAKYMQATVAQSLADKMEEEVNLNQPTETLELPQQAEEVNLASDQAEILPDVQELEQATTVSDSSNVYSREEFYQVFKDVFSFGANTFNCQSLEIQPDEELGARATSNRIYVEAEKYKFLHFIIERDSGKFGEAILIISFLIKKINGVAEDKKISNIWRRLWQGLTRIITKRKMAKGSVSSAQAGQEKPEKPENYLKPANV